MKYLFVSFLLLSLTAYGQKKSVENKDVIISWTCKKKENGDGVKVVYVITSNTNTNTQYYTVTAGDSGYKIAEKLGVAFTELSKVNPNADWNKLKLGQQINIPSKSNQAVLQKLEFDYYTREIEENDEDLSKFIEFQDYNFDGHEDFRIYDYYMVQQRVFKYFLYNPNSKNYSFHERLSNLDAAAHSSRGSLTFDAATKRIHCTVSETIEYSSGTYVFIDGKNQLEAITEFQSENLGSNVTESYSRKFNSSDMVLSIQHYFLHDDGSREIEKCMYNMKVTLLDGTIVNLEGKCENLAGDLLAFRGLQTKD